MPAPQEVQQTQTQPKAIDGGTSNNVSWLRSFHWKVFTLKAYGDVQQHAMIANRDNTYKGNAEIPWLPHA